MPTKVETTVTTLQILVVDDNREAADTLGWLLGMWGYDVRAVYNACDALDAVRSLKPCCVLSDLDMPGIDGYRLAELLRENKSFQGLALIAISGNGSITRAKTAGYDYYLGKPANLLLLKEMLRRISANPIAQRWCNYAPMLGFSAYAG